MDKKQLYETIMRNVSKQVKKTLNESDDDTATAIWNIFQGLQDMVQQSHAGCDSGDFSWAAECVAREIVDNMDFVCNCDPKMLGETIQEIISNGF